MENYRQRFDPVDSLYSHFEQEIALTWAKVQLENFLRKNPLSNYDEQKNYFLDSIESGFSIALEMRDYGN